MNSETCSWVLDKLNGCLRQRQQQKLMVQDLVMQSSNLDGNYSCSEYWVRSEPFVSGMEGLDGCVPITRPGACALPSSASRGGMRVNNPAASPLPQPLLCSFDHICRVVAVLLLKYLEGMTGSTQSPAQATLCFSVSLWAGHTFCNHVLPFIWVWYLALLWIMRKTLI